MAHRTAPASDHSQISNDSVPLLHARSRLAVVWLTSSGIIFLLLIVQSVLGKYESKVEQVWSWILPGLMPTLTLIISVLGADALRPAKAANSYVRKGFFHLSLGLSLAYLLLILFTILVEPFVTATSLDLFSMSNLWLGPFQGLVASAIGLVFFSKHSKEPED